MSSDGGRGGFKRRGGKDYNFQGRPKNEFLANRSNGDAPQQKQQRNDVGNENGLAREHAMNIGLPKRWMYCPKFGHVSFSFVNSHLSVFYCAHYGNLYIGFNRLGY